MHTTEALLILVVSLGAFLMPFISKKINIPSSVAEIFFGLIIGLFFSEIFKQTEIVKFLGELGFIILMYLAGMEINFELIKKLKTKTKLIFLLTNFLIVIFSFITVLYFNLPNIYGLVILTTAIGLLFPILKDLNLLSTNFGQALLVIGGIGEVLSLIFITIYFVIAKNGFSMETLLHLIKIYAFFTFVYLLLKLFKLLVWWYPEKIISVLKSEGISEISVRMNISNMFIFVSLAVLLGLEPVIGAFFGGMIFSALFKEKEDIIHKLSSFGYGFLIPIFFIDVGLRFNLLELIQPHIIIEALFLSILILSVRFLASLILRFAGFSFKEIILTPFALSFPLTLLAAIATIGYEINLLSKDNASAILLTAILTAFLYPFIFRNFAKKLLS